jgi:NAD(P)-dependent dehydrogenase (short-subunit alcohol dehydrogenase family)
MSGRLDGQVTLVTGAASGIGQGIARRFVGEGSRCVVVDIQDEPGLEFVRELGSEVAVYTHADAAMEDDAVRRDGHPSCFGSRAHDMTTDHRPRRVGC